MYISPNGDYPRHYGDIQAEHSSWKLGDELPKGWIPVSEIEPPTQGINQILYEDFPVEVEGVMTQNWQVRDMTDEEIERRDAPKTARAKLVALGLTDLEVDALIRGLR